MLSKSVLINIKHLKPKNIQQAIIIQELLKGIVCFLIERKLINEAYVHLEITYNYSSIKADLLDIDSTIPVFSIIEEHELTSIKHFINKAIEEFIDEFYMYNKRFPNNILNFNSCLINTDTFILSAEVLSKEQW